MPDVRADTAQYSCKIAGDLFQVITFNGHEEVSSLFRFNLLLWKDDPEVDIASKVRQTAEIKVAWGSNERTYYGIVAGMTQTGAGRIGEVDEEHGYYSLEVVPTLWLLGQQSNCKIFQDMSADEVITAVLDDRGMSGKYDVQLSRSYPKREYCVQYRETDLAFISRLMEEEGIFYFFSHDGEEKMVIGDDAAAWATCAPEDSVEYHSGTGRLPTADEYVGNLSYEESAYSGKVKMKDFRYLEPKKPLKVESTADQNTDLELYDYHPERYPDDGRGRTLATDAVEAQSAMRTVLSASGTWRSATCGATCTLERAYRSDLNRSWVILSVHHAASQEGGVSYDVSFTAIPADNVFRPLPRTPQPMLNPQTATVVGPAGEEIYMDKHGRAKVQFHWDLDGQKDESSSCWIRVAQHYAGINEDTQKKHGFHWHPLIGDEVVVDFLEGDPDRPLIVGSVYNGVNTPIIKPEELIRNIMLTRYQHRLLLDDKNGQITLNTGADQHLIMSDLRDSKGKIELKTQGSESLLMEDGSSGLGNMIRLETADRHYIELAEQEQQGIIAATKENRRLVLTDDEQRVFIQTVDGHIISVDDRNRHIAAQTQNRNQLILSDDDQRIIAQTAAGHRIEISDRNNKITVRDSSSSHKLEIDIGGSKITLSTTGSMELNATNQIDIKSKKVTIDADTDVNVRCKDLNVRASSDVNARAGSNIQMRAGNQIQEQAASKIKASAAIIEQNAQAQLKQKAAIIQSKATGMYQLKGAMVISKAQAINKISGALVKIN